MSDTYSAQDYQAGRIPGQAESRHAKRRRERERQMQERLKAWRDSFPDEHPVRMLRAIPNHRTAGGRVGEPLQVAGTPDLLLAVSGTWRGLKYNTLWLELKVPPNCPSEKQEKEMERLGRWGNASAVCYSVEETKKAVLRYLGLD